MNSIMTQSSENKPAINVQRVYRLPNGEWSDVSENADRSLYYLAYERKYTPGGHLLEETEWDENGEVVQKTVNHYDEKEYLVLHEHFEGEYLAEKMSYAYNDKGIMIRETRDFEEGYPVHTIYEYNDDGTLREKRTDDDEGELERRETFVWHPEWKDKLIRHEVYDEEDKLTLEEENEWELRDGEVKAKQLIVRDHSLGTYRKTVFFNPKEREDHIAYVTYNEKDKVIEIFRVFHDEKMRETEERSESVNASDNYVMLYSYDDNDRVTEQEHRQDDKIISKHIRSYNEEGYPLYHAFKSINRGIFVDYFEYEYYS
ncbi:MAG: hypothetical protein Fur0041_20300 [Bacteroidia bacterium]